MINVFSFHRSIISSIKRSNEDTNGRKKMLYNVLCVNRGGKKKKLKIVEARIEQFSRLDAIELVVSLVKLLQPMIFRFIKL